MMKDKSELNLPQDLLYTDEHIWAKKQPDGSWIAGISDFAQDQLGEVVYVDLPDTDAHFDKGQEFGSVESVKSVNALYMPVAGTIQAHNEALEDDPSAVNTDCYGKGWMVRITPDAGAAEDALKSADAYRAALK